MSGFDDRPGRDNLPMGGPFDDTSKDGLLPFGDVPGGDSISDVLGFQGDAGGIATLPQSLTINGQTVAATYFYDAANATTSTWTGTGGTLTAAGSGGVQNLDSPTAGSADRAFDCEKTRYFDSGVVSPWTSQDAFLEAVFYYDDTTLGIANGANASIEGWSFVTSNNERMQFTIDDGTTQVSHTTANGSMTQGWNHVAVVVDKSTQITTYINGVDAGNSASIAAIGDLPQYTFYIGSRRAALDGYIDNVAYFGAWFLDSWFSASDTAEIDALARERHRRVTGTYATGATAQSNARASAAYLPKVSHEDSVTRLHYVGANWPRLARAYDATTDRTNDNVYSNSFPLSEDYSTATWGKVRCTIDTSTGVFYKGREAQGIVGTAVDNSHGITSSLTPTSNNKHIMVGVFKAGARDAVRFGSFDILAAQVFAQFKLDGTASEASLTSANVIGTPGIQSLGDGWYRCWMAYDGGTAAHLHFVAPIDDAEVDDLTYTGDGVTVDLHVAEVQHDYSDPIDGRTNPINYIETTGSGRTIGVTLPGYLSENSSTNLATQSEDLSAAAWTKTAATITADDTEAPNQEITADSIDEDGTNGAHFVFQTVTVTSAQYCFSLWARPINRDWIALELNSPGSSIVYFDIATGAVGTAGANVDEAVIENWGNGWYRCWSVVTMSAGARNWIVFAANGDLLNSYQGATQQSVHIWGAQVNLGTHPSTYIPTTTTTATRLEDSLVYSTTSDLTKGTLAVDLLQPGADLSSLGNNRLVVLSDGTDNNRILPYTDNTDNSYRYFANNAGVTQANINGSVPVPNEWQEYRVTWDTDDFASYVDGVDDGTDTSGTAPAGMDEISVGQPRNGGGGRTNALLRPRVFLKPTTKKVTNQPFGIRDLPKALTINGIRVNPSVWYEGRNASLTEWSGIGGELTAAGSGGSVGNAVPSSNSADKAADCEGTRYWQDSGSTIGDITTEDFVVETVFQYGADGDYVFSKFATNGWIAFSNIDRLGMFVSDGTIAQAFTAASSLVAGNWYHGICFIDRSGSMQWYLNGVASGSPASVSGSAGSLTTVAGFTMGADNGGSTNWQSNIAQAAMWKQPAWLDTHLQPGIAASRYAIIGL